MIVCYLNSTETALLHITNCLLESTDQGRVSILSLLDLSAVVNTVDHSSLLERLHTSFGISGLALRWLRSYILAILQVVEVNSISSTSQRLDFGVPQGSVLGPLLFVLNKQPISRIVLFVTTVCTVILLVHCIDSDDCYYSLYCGSVQRRELKTFWGSIALYKCNYYQSSSSSSSSYHPHHLCRHGKDQQ